MLEELDKVLAELEELLASESFCHWSNYIADCRDRLAKSDASCLDKLLQAYGGMGSLNDLVLASNEDERLSALRTKAYKIANALKRKENLN